jgi:hypothetical protein
MSEQRLSNLQKWILVNCYKVTVLRERTDSALARCDHFDKTKCRDNVTPHTAHPNIYDCKTRKYDGVPLACTAFEFTQNDIYRNYYGLEPSRRKALFINTVYFKHTPGSDKIYNTTMRTLKNLKEKGLLIYSNSGGAKPVILTITGRTTAEKLLEDKSITVKPQKRNLPKSQKRKERTGSA